MSISVTRNPDGTYTISCGDGTITVGSASAGGAGGGGLPPVPTGNDGGFTANLIQRLDRLPRENRASFRLMDAPSRRRHAVSNWLYIARPGGPRARPTSDSTVIIVEWTGTGTADVGMISAALSESGIDGVFVVSPLPAGLRNE